MGGGGWWVVAGWGGGGGGGINKGEGSEIAFICWCHHNENTTYGVT